MENKILQNNIPNGWQEVKVGEVFDFLGTYAISRDNLANGILNGEAIGNIHYGDIHAQYKASSIDLDKIEIPQARDKEFSPSKKDLLVDGDLVMTDVSEDYEGIGEAISIHGIGDKKVVGGLHTFVLRDRKGKTDEHYRQYIFKNPDIRSVLKKIANGISVYGVSKSGLSKITLNLPSIKEQKRIVAVLETWDKSIEKLAEKIKTKKNIKKGLMQNLLTGKTRLAGFEKEWFVVTLDKLCSISTGKKDVNEGNPSGKYPFFTCAREYTYSDNYSYDMEAILIAGNADVGHCKYYNGKFEAYQRTYILSNFVNVDATFLFLFLSYYFKNYVESLKQIGAMSYIKLPMLKEYFVKLPDIKEQGVIADILIKADLEIKKLEEKLRIIKDQKKYLLNSLIAGKIRTPENF